jgi:hypothetical protein
MSAILKSFFLLLASVLVNIEGCRGILASGLELFNIFSDKFLFLLVLQLNLLFLLLLDFSGSLGFLSDDSLLLQLEIVEIMLYDGIPLLLGWIQLGSRVQMENFEFGSNTVTHS